MLSISCTISDPPFSKDIKLDTNLCKTIDDIKDLISSQLQINQSQFVIDYPTKGSPISSILKDQKLQITIQKRCNDIEFCLPNQNKIRIRNSYRLKKSEVISFFEQNDIYFSNNFVSNSLQFLISGKNILDIPYPFFAVPNHSMVEIKSKNKFVIINCYQIQLFFSEGELASSVLNKIKEILKIKQKFSISIFSGKNKTLIPESHKLISGHEYAVKIMCIFIFICKPNPNHKLCLNQDYSVNVSDAKNSLSAILSNSLFNIYDKNQCLVTDEKKLLIEIQNSNGEIWFDYDQSWKTAKNEKFTMNHSIYEDKRRAIFDVEKPKKPISSSKSIRKKYCYKINNDDEIHEIVLEKGANIRLFKKEIGRLNRIKDLSCIKIYFNEKELFDEQVLDDIEFGFYNISIIICSKDDLHIEKQSQTKVKQSKNSVKLKNFKPTVKPVSDDEDEIITTKNRKIKTTKHASIESEEDIFMNEDKKIFRFLSVSFIEHFHKEIIGRGATSEVFKVTHEKYPTKVFALKRIYLELIKLENDDDDDDEFKIDISRMKRFLQEFEVIKLMSHKNIIKTYGFCLGDEKNAPSILLEYCPSNLKKMIKKLSDEERASIIIETSEAMREIHQNGIIHRDLKPENILIDSNKNVKVSDFGICTLINQDTESSSRTQFSGTLQFMAPELINRSKKYDEKVDVYSFGVVCYFILTKGKLPDISLVDVGTGKQADIPKSFSSISKNIIKKCWEFDPKERPSFIEVCEIINRNKHKLI